MIAMNAALRVKCAERFVHFSCFTGRASTEIGDQLKDYGQVVGLIIHDNSEYNWDDRHGNLKAVFETVQASAYSSQLAASSFPAVVDQYNLNLPKHYGKQAYFSILSTEDIALYFSVNASGGVDIDLGAILARLNPYDPTREHMKGFTLFAHNWVRGDETSMWTTNGIDNYAYPLDSGYDDITNKNLYTDTVNYRAWSVYGDCSYLGWSIQGSVGTHGSGQDIEFLTADSVFVEHMQPDKEGANDGKLTITLKFPSVIQHNKTPITVEDVFHTTSTLTHFDNYHYPWRSQSCADLTLARDHGIVVFNYDMTWLNSMYRGRSNERDGVVVGEYVEGRQYYFEMENPRYTREVSLPAALGHAVVSREASRLINGQDSFAIGSWSYYNGWQTWVSNWKVPDGWGDRIGVKIDFGFTSPNANTITFMDALGDSQSFTFDLNTRMGTYDYLTDLSKSFAFRSTSAASRVAIRFFFNPSEFTLAGSVGGDSSITTLDTLLQRRKTPSTDVIDFTHTITGGTAVNYPELIDRKTVIFDDDKQTVSLANYTSWHLKPSRLSGVVYFEVELLTKAQIAALLGIDESRVVRGMKCWLDAGYNSTDWAWNNQAWATSLFETPADFENDTQTHRIGICYRLDTPLGGGFVELDGQPLPETWKPHTRNAATYAPSTRSDFDAGNTQISHASNNAVGFDFTYEKNASLAFCNGNTEINNPTLYTSFKIITDPTEFLYSAPAEAVTLPEFISAHK